MSPTTTTTSATPAAGGAAPSSVQIREGLVEALNLDLVGPTNDSTLAWEALPQAPSRWYLTGFLAPLGGNAEQRSDEEENEEVDEIDNGGGADDNQTPEPAAARRAFYPSSIGMSFLVSSGAQQIAVIARWGDYRRAEGAGDAGEGRGDYVQGVEGEGAKSREGRGEGDGGERGDKSRVGDGGDGVEWRRTPREEKVKLALPAHTDQPREAAIPGSDGLKLVLTVRPVNLGGLAGGMMPSGTRAVSLFLVNTRRPAPDEVRDEAYTFQTQLEVQAETPLVPRLNLRGLGTDEWDEQVADLQYRDVCEFAVGHGIATEADLDEAGHCRTVRTCWIPTSQVERVAPAAITGVELEMEALAALADSAEVQAKLGALAVQYRQWIDAQAALVPVAPPNRKQTGDLLIQRAKVAAGRIEAGVKLLETDPQALDSFRIANRVMAIAARQRFGVMQGKDPAKLDPPAWRPFQLAFILMNLVGIVDPLHGDRKVVDLLFFPTGGGKTEAYLGLAAFTLVLRRLKNPGVASAGLSVLMRYTLRLLTLDQLGRASTLICALELERLKDPVKLGPWPFEIGLWVGKAATPNRMGGPGDPDPNCAYRKTIAYRNGERKPSPIPLEECPWCGTKFQKNSFQLYPSAKDPQDLRVLCMNRHCEFTRERPLPILAVDEPIYRRLPCFMIATVDKFAAMPWTGLTGGFFGRVERFGKDGFYGPCDDPATGKALDKPLLPPDLVIQDELHLISGPMGTMVGLYESALDELCMREVEERKICPKVIASTATVRRAERQIRAIFNRHEVDIFPPPGPNLRDSFFAKTHTPEQSNARLYVGLAAQGRNPKLLLLRASLVLLGAAQKAWIAAGGKRNKDNPADPYMTLLGYFNSLRELGGSRRILEDEVSTRLTGYSNRKRNGQAEGLFADRKIAYDVLELTSRITTDKVADTKRRLALPFHDDEHVDVAIATNMISVGLDITRLGLMLVFGQPKTSAEYIQATSRVGRAPERPGLVVTLLNIHKPRDRSHYERFATYHKSFYRSVEATSVTPFSPRALDRGIAGTTVALARLAHRPMTPPKGAMSILAERGRLSFVADRLAERARMHAPMSAADAQALRQKVRDRIENLLDTWESIAHDYQTTGTQLQYQQYEGGGARPLLYDFLSPDLKLLPARHWKFRANRSMRDVEPSVNLWLRTMDDIEVEND